MCGQFNASVKPRSPSRGGKIIPFDLELRRPSDIWLSYHPRNGRSPRGSALIGWLVAAFNPARFQWVNDEFLDPMELKAVYKGKSPAHLFGAFRLKDDK
jgi:hypothetical protein